MVLSCFILFFLILSYLIISYEILLLCTQAKKLAVWLSMTLVNWSYSAMHATHNPELRYYTAVLAEKGKASTYFLIIS